MIIIRIDGNLKDYNDFVDDLASKMTERVTEADKREFISQRKACDLFGRRNVERWRREGKIDFTNDRERWNTRFPTFAAC